MKMILDSKDIESLIQEKYDGVESVDMPENIEISITIDSAKFLKTKTVVNIPTTPPVQIKKQNPDELQATEAQKGLMASGGNERRNLIKF